jgi:hypothetical protein
MIQKDTKKRFVKNPTMPFFIILFVTRDGIHEFFTH